MRYTSTIIPDYSCKENWPVSLAERCHEFRAQHLDDHASALQILRHSQQCKDLEGFEGVSGKMGGKQPFAEDARSQMLPTEAAIQKISERDHRSELKTSEFRSSLGSTMCFFVSFGHSL